MNVVENAFTTFTMFTKGAKRLKTWLPFVNAGERNCSRTFTSVHQRSAVSSVIAGEGQRETRIQKAWSPACVGNDARRRRNVERRMKVVAAVPIVLEDLGIKAKPMEHRRSIPFQFGCARFHSHSILFRMPA